MEDLSTFCCQNPECPDYGKRGQGELSVTMRYGPQKKRRVLYCKTCKARFSERKGTPMFDTRLPEEKVVAILAHLSEGCGVRKTSRLVGVSKDTVTACGKDRLPGDLRHGVRRDGGLGRVASEQGHQHGLCGTPQRDRPQPQREEGPQDLLFLEGLGRASSRDLLHYVQLQFLLGCANAPRTDSRWPVVSANPSHGRRPDGSCLAPFRVAGVSSRTTIVGHQGIIRSMMYKESQIPPRKESLRRQLEAALTDAYDRHGKKKSRHHPRRKEEPSAGKPQIRAATENHKQKLRQLESLNHAA